MGLMLPLRGTVIVSLREDPEHVLRLLRAIDLLYSFFHSGHFYSAPSSPLPLRDDPDYSTDTVSGFHAEAHRQLQVKDLPKVPT